MSTFPPYESWDPEAKKPVLRLPGWSRKLDPDEVERFWAELAEDDLLDARATVEASRPVVIDDDDDRRITSEFDREEDQ